MKQIIYIGNYSNHGIYFLEFTDGNLKLIGNTADESNCSYLYQHHNVLYNVVEIVGDSKTDSGFVTSRSLSSLNILNKNSSYGKAPCYITVDKKRNILYVANYVSGSFSAFALNPDGSIR